MAFIPELRTGPPLVRELRTGGHPTLANLRPGDTFEAKIISSGPDTIALQLSDGTQVTAAGANGQELPVGDILTFTVTGRMQGSVTVDMRPSAEADDAGAQLRTLGLERTAQNLRLADALKSAGLPLSRESLSQLSAALDAHPSLTLPQAVFMVRGGIAFTDSNVAALGAFLRREAVIGETLQTLMDILASADEQAASSSEPAPPADAREAGEASVSPPGSLVGEARDSALPGRTELPSASVQNAPESPLSTPETVFPQTASARAQDTPPAFSVPLPLGEEAATASSPSADFAAPAEAQEAVADLSPQASAPRPTPETPQRSPRPAPTQTDTPNAPVSRQDTEAPTQNARPSPLSLASAQPAAPRPDAAADVPHPDSGINAPAPDIYAGGGELGYAALRSRIGRLFRTVDRTRADALPRELDVPRLMRELGEVVRTLEESATDMPPAARERLSAATRVLETSLTFLGKLGNMAAFVQLPLQINGDRASAELYIFNDGKPAKKIDAENATLFLSLRTANTGRVEAFVKVIGRNIECDFSLESAPAADLLRAEMPALLSLLDAQGFRLQRTSSGVKNRPSDALDFAREREARASRYRFDRSV